MAEEILEAQETERQTNYTIMEGDELPSRGQVYTPAINPHIELRSMTARDEMKRQATSSTNFKTMSDIIEGCLIEKPKRHVYDMCLGDYEFLLHKIRLVTYGPEYNMEVACPHCGKKFMAKTDLGDETVKLFDGDTKEEFLNLQYFILPISGDNIKIRFQTPRMIDEIVAKTKNFISKHPDTELDVSILFLLEAVIEEINGNKVDPMKIENYINRMPAKDMRVIINNVNKINGVLGLDTSVKLECPKCRGEVNTFFRQGPEFFGPTDL